jgi:peptide-methionine (S)-S-oxide reductase
LISSPWTESRKKIAGSDCQEDRSREGRAETATLGAGCFWCFDAIARRTEGVRSSVVGFSGAAPPLPSDDEIHRFDLPYVEVIQVQFEPDRVTFEEVLDLFFLSHDPTTPNRDGANHGRTYHSTIFFHTEAQRRQAERSIGRQEARRVERLVTSLRPFTGFMPAGEEHQDFFGRNPSNPYCQTIIAPKLEHAGDRA